MVTDDSHSSRISRELDGVAMEILMFNIKKPHMRRGLSQRLSWFVRPRTIKLAFLLVRLASEIAKFFDRFS
jgi:hypothetical protein